MLLRHLLWAGVDLGLPLQLHTGFGDPDPELRRGDPRCCASSWRTEPAGVPLMLLHCYPYHRQPAGWPRRSRTSTGSRADPQLHRRPGAAVVGESLELAPFGRLLFSSDAWGPAELHYLGALLWRRATARVLGEWVADGDWSQADAPAGRGDGRRGQRPPRVPPLTGRPRWGASRTWPRNY